MHTTHAHLKPADLDDFTVDEIEALNRHLSDMLARERADREATNG